MAEGKDYLNAVWGDWIEFNQFDAVDPEARVSVRFGNSGTISNLVAGSFDWNNVTQYRVCIGETYDKVY